MIPSRRTALLPAALLALATAAMPSPARAADGYVWASFTLSNGTYFVDPPSLRYLAGPDACPKVGVGTTWGGFWLTLPGIGSFWVWSGYKFTTLTAEQSWEIRSTCAPAGCIYVNSYCAYSGLIAAPAGAVQSFVSLACPNDTFPDAPAVQTGPITTLVAPQTVSAGFSDMIGAASKPVWSDWNARCGVFPPPNTRKGF